MNYYQRIKDVREDNDLKQAYIAKLLETSVSKISDYETGKIMMRIDKYIKLAKHYNISLDYLAGIIDEPRPLYEENRRTPEQELIIKYNEKKEYQQAINKLLDIKK